MNTPSKNLTLLFLAIAVVFVVGYGKYKYSEARAEAKAKANPANCFMMEGEDDEDGKWVKTPAGSYRQAGDGKCIVGKLPPPPPPQQTVEALVPKGECVTPCSNFVGYDYKIRTDGDPLRIKYNGCDWVDRPARGLFTPKCFNPGDTEFESPDKANPHVKVWVYERVNIRR